MSGDRIRCFVQQSAAESKAMQPAEHDPLQFGAAEEQAPPEDLPAAYGTSSDPLAPQQQQQQQQQSWQHYPDPAPSAPPEAATATTAFSGSQQQQQATTHYPNVPAPSAAAVNYQISLGSAGSAGSGSLGGGGSTSATPRSPSNAAATLGLATALSTMPASNPALRIVVLNPLRHMGPSGIPGLEEAYISYEVVTTTTLPHFSGGRFSVRRRFRDVVSLSNLLPKLLHGSFLPARPDKNLIEGRRMTDAFIEARRLALERYLNRLAAHPAACRSEVLRVFLEADGNLRSNPAWRALKPNVLTPTQATSRLLRSLVGVRQKPPTPSEAVNPAAQTRDIYRLLHENIQYYRGSFQHSPLSSEEVAMRDETSLVEDAATALHIALHRAEALARLAAARGVLLSEASVALAALGTFEGSYSYGDPATVQAASTAAQASQSAGTVASSASASLSAALQPLRDHHAITPNVLGALHSRERALLTVSTLRQDLEDKRAKLSAAQLMPASQAKKVDSLRSQVSQLEVSSAAAEAEYSRQLARNKEELAGLRDSRGRELTAMLAELAGCLLQQEQQEATIWNNLLAKLPQPRQTTAYMAQRDLVIGPLT